MSAKRYTIDQLQGKNDLIGKWFHSFEMDGNTKITKWQGQVLSRKGAEYRVQLYSWALGHDTDKVMVHSDDMQDWHFYDNDEDMRYWWETDWNKRKASL